MIMLIETSCLRASNNSVMPQSRRVSQEPHTVKMRSSRPIVIVIRALNSNTISSFTFVYIYISISQVNKPPLHIHCMQYNNHRSSGFLARPKWLCSRANTRESTIYLQITWEYIRRLAAIDLNFAHTMRRRKSCSRLLLIFSEGWLWRFIVMGIDGKSLCHTNWQFGVLRRPELIKMNWRPNEIG